MQTRVLPCSQQKKYGCRYGSWLIESAGHALGLQLLSALIGTAVIPPLWMRGESKLFNDIAGVHAGSVTAAGGLGNGAAPRLRQNAGLSHGQGRGSTHYANRNFRSSGLSDARRVCARYANRARPHACGFDIHASPRPTAYICMYQYLRVRMPVDLALSQQSTHMLAHRSLACEDSTATMQEGSISHPACAMPRDSTCREGQAILESTYSPMFRHSRFNMQHAVYTMLISHCAHLFPQSPGGASTVNCS